MISYFQLKCSICGFVFQAPVLSDFSYGDFIYDSQSGKYFAYLNIFEDKVVFEVNEILKQEKNLLNQKGLVDGIWQVFPITCDLAPDGSPFERKIRECPFCKKRSLIQSKDPIGVHEVPPITHVEWNNLETVEKRNRIVSKMNYALHF
jgi:hypothetical protein